MEQLTIKPDVRLYHNRVLVAAGKVASLSLMGVYIENCDTTIPKYTSLELEFVHPAIDSSEQDRVPVIVTSCSNEWVGLIFVWSNPSMRDKWRAIASNFLNKAVNKNPCKEKLFHGHAEVGDGVQT